MGPGALGLDPYILAHGVLFWVVMAVPRLRRMGFEYSFALNRHLMGLAFLIALIMGFFRIQWIGNLLSPSQQYLVLPFFRHHAALFRMAATASLLGGFAVTLFFLWAIQRWGMPCGLTAMVLWDSGSLLVMSLPSWFREVSINAGIPSEVLRAKILAVTAILAGFLFLGWRRLNNRPPRRGGMALWERIWEYLGSGDPPAAVYGTFSTGTLSWVLTFLLSLLLATGLLAKIHPLLTESHWNRWAHQHFALPGIFTMALILPSVLLFSRWIYNPSLRLRFQARLGLAEASAEVKQRARSSLLLWCGIISAVSALQMGKHFLARLGGAWWAVTLFSFWDLLLAVIAVLSLAAHYRDRRERFCRPVMTHGYHEPIFAARALLVDKGISSRIWGEPYGLFSGIIVGPIAMKYLLVREEDLERAKGTLEEATKGGGGGIAPLPSDAHNPPGDVVEG